MKCVIEVASGVVSRVSDQYSKELVATGKYDFCSKAVFRKKKTEGKIVNLYEPK